MKAERRLRLRHRLKGQLGAGKGWGAFGRKEPRGWRGEGWREGHMGEEGRTRKDVRGRRLGREGDLGGRRRQGPRLVRAASVWGKGRWWVRRTEGSGEVLMLQDVSPLRKKLWPEGRKGLWRAEDLGGCRKLRNIAGVGVGSEKVRE